MKLASIRPHITFWALRGAWVIAIALWGVALVPWFGPPQTRPHEPVRLARDDRPPADGRASNEAASDGKPEPVFVPQRSRAATIAEAASAPAERAARLEVCGLGEGGPSSDGQRAAHVARQGQLGLHAAFDELRARGEPQAQAAAWWLRVLWAREGGGDTMQPCAPGAECPGGAPATALPPLSTAVDALAQAALASSDPWVAQIAARACDAPVPSAVCSSLPPRRWATLEPDNAAAWLEPGTRDSGPVDEVLARAARTSRFDLHRGRLAAWVLQALPERVPVLQRHAAWQRADELERAADAKAMAGIARPCSEGVQRDSARTQLCEPLARWLRPEAARADAPAVAAPRAYDCGTLERQWREARDAAQRGVRVAAQAPAQRP